MSDFKYAFAPYINSNSKGFCPQCGHKTWVRYINTETNELLPEMYGRCDREVSCGHVEIVKNYTGETTGEVVLPPIKQPYFNTIPSSLMEKSLEDNIRYTDNLSTFLIRKFGKKAVDVLSLYKVGCSTAFDGNSTVFWQIDTEGRIRTGKIIKYGLDGKRQKNPPRINWTHSFYSGEYQLEQTWFGAHLLSEFPDKRVGVLESEKSCVITSIKYPDIIWIAAGMLQGLSEHKMELIKDRETIFTGDKGRAHQIWKTKVREWKNPKWQVSDFIEKQSSLEEGEDIADLILKNFGKVK